MYACSVDSNVIHSTIIAFVRCTRSILCALFIVSRSIRVQQCLCSMSILSVSLVVNRKSRRRKWNISLNSCNFTSHRLIELWTRQFMTIRSLSNWHSVAHFIDRVEMLTFTWSQAQVSLFFDFNQWQFNWVIILKSIFISVFIERQQLSCWQCETSDERWVNERNNETKWANIWTHWHSLMRCAFSSHSLSLIDVNRRRDYLHYRIAEKASRETEKKYMKIAGNIFQYIFLIFLFSSRFVSLHSFIVIWHWRGDWKIAVGKITRVEKENIGNELKRELVNGNLLRRTFYTDCRIDGECVRVIDACRRQRRRPRQMNASFLFRICTRRYWWWCRAESLDIFLIILPWISSLWYRLLRSLSLPSFVASDMSIKKKKKKTIKRKCRDKIIFNSKSLNRSNAWIIIFHSVLFFSL